LERNKTIIPQKKSKVGRPPKDAKLILSGIFYIISSDAQWLLLTDYYGKTSTVHGKFRQWTISCCFEKILQRSIDLAIKKFGSPEYFISDTS
jgi:transposase